MPLGASLKLQTCLLPNSEQRLIPNPLDLRPHRQFQPPQLSQRSDLIFDQDLALVPRYPGNQGQVVVTPPLLVTRGSPVANPAKLNRLRIRTSVRLISR